MPGNEALRHEAGPPWPQTGSALLGRGGYCAAALTALMTAAGPGYASASTPATPTGEVTAPWVIAQDLIFALVDLPNRSIDRSSWR